MNKLRKIFFFSGSLKSLFLLSFLVFSLLLKGQQSLVFDEGFVDFRKGMELFQKEKFASAQAYFEKSMENAENKYSEVHLEAQFYHALAAVELFHANAESLLLEFIEQNPDSPHLLEAYFNLAKFQFRKKKYRSVIDYLAQVDPLDLSFNQRAEYYFKKGYAEFQLEQADDAAQSFYEIKDSDNPYVNAARYYYAHISYLQKKYQTAANNFDKIKNDPLFGPLVPYYLTQIFYLQEKYDTLLAYAPPVLDSAPPKREDEIRKLIGDAYYKTKQFEAAIPFLEAYSKVKTQDQKDYYQLGYSYFMIADYQETIRHLKKAVGSDETLSQSAYYYLGRANVELDNKRAARAAFKNAHQLDVDPEITEDALFNYAKTAYELSYHPYDDAIRAFETYINAYPNSTKLNDAYEYLVGVYYTTKNYEEALKSIDRIEQKDLKLLQAKQRLAFYRGIELYNQDQFAEAEDHFQLSLKHAYDPTLTASAKFWLAQSYFQLKDYENADNFYSEFLASSRARSLPYYEKGYYHLAYNFYERKKYRAAIFWFREYIDKAKLENKGLITDAYLRIGDCYFIQSDFQYAVGFYDRASEIGSFDKDYALLQSAIGSGILGDLKLKAKKLAQLVKTETASVYLDDALFELGKTYLLMDKPEEALSYYTQLLNDFPNSNYLAETYLKVGLIHYNQKEDDLALNAFNTVVKKYKGSKFAKEAFNRIRKIYIEKGDVKAFQDYANGVPFADISKAELDSTAYIIAENSYLDGNCDKASRDFTNYLKQYPEGIFRLNAHYYRADCEAKSGFLQEAAKDFEAVRAMPANKFSEKAVRNLVWIYRKIGHEQSAIHAARELLDLASRKESVNQAELNLMELYFQVENYDSAAFFAENILNRKSPEVKLNQKAMMVVAKSAYENEDYALAIQSLDSLSNLSNELGAEAKYLLAQTHYLQGNYDQSDTVTYRLLDQIPTYPYWVAKGFILLADNFIAKQDYYNARLAFENVIDNADQPELVEIAKEKLRLMQENLKKAEKKESEVIEVEFNQGEPSDQRLFEEDSLNQTPTAAPLNQKEDQDEE